MRLCILASEYPSTTQTFVYEPIEWLRARGHPVQVVAERRGNLPGMGAASFPATITPRQWIDRRTKLRNLAGSPAESARRYRTARRWSRGATWSSLEILARSLFPALSTAESVLAHFGPFGVRWLPAVATAQKPYAVFFHGYDATSWLTKEPGAYQRLIASGAGFITNGEYLQSRLVAAGVPPERVAICRYGASTDVAAVSENPNLSTARLLTIARLVEKKGVADSITAFAAAQDVLQGQWEYDVVGDGALLPSLRELAQRLGVGALVRFHGFLSRADTIKALLGASVFMLASRTAADGDTEGTPVSIIEAATLGLPVASTVHAGIPEILPTEAAAAGLLVPEGDVVGLARALRRLGSSAAERRCWGDANRTHARARYSAASHVTSLIEGLARVARPPRAG
jgi:colanic acid/amylovoran biosynthesis glycosyltransferase